MRTININGFSISSLTLEAMVGPKITNAIFNCDRSILVQLAATGIEALSSITGVGPKTVEKIDEWLKSEEHTAILTTSQMTAITIIIGMLALPVPRDMVEWSEEAKKANEELLANPEWMAEAQLRWRWLTRTEGVKGKVGAELCKTRIREFVSKIESPTSNCLRFNAEFYNGERSRCNWVFDEIWAVNKARGVWNKRVSANELRW